MGHETCGNCRYARAADTAVKYGLIPESEYQKYIHGYNYGHPYAGSFGYCKVIRRFVAEEESCGRWELLRDPTEFGAP